MQPKPKITAHHVPDAYQDSMSSSHVAYNMTLLALQRCTAGKCCNREYPAAAINASTAVATAATAQRPAMAASAALVDTEAVSAAVNHPSAPDVQLQSAAITEAPVQWLYQWH